MTPEQDALENAKFTLLGKHNSVFVSTLLFDFTLVWDRTIPTLCVNLTTIRINPEFFLKVLTPGDRSRTGTRVSALIHETWHVALDHIARGQEDGRDPKIDNMAGDYVINDLLELDSFEIDKQNWLWDTKYRSWSTEEVYNDLTKNQKQRPQNPKDLGDDVDSSNDGKTPEEGGMTKQQAKEKLDAMLAKAYMQTQILGEPEEIGKLPGELVRYIENLINPKVRWEELLQNECTEISHNDYSSKKFNRKFLPDFYLPTLYSESIGHIALLCDASGSIGIPEFTQFFSEGSAIKELLLPEKMTIVSWDTEIQSEYVYEQYDPLDFPELKGGGGTEIIPVLEWINKNQPDISIIFTDGDFYQNNLPTCDANIIWLIYNKSKFTSKIGRIIHF